MITVYSKAICKFESIISKYCYSQSRRKYYRYPVHYRKAGELYVCSGLALVPEESIGSMYYKFGTNILYIGKALNEVVEYLDSHYDDSVFDWCFINDDGELLETEELICLLERIVGRNCYNEEFHTRYRYPVKYKKANVEYESRGLAKCNNSGLGTLHYEFGDNSLYIGAALSKILEYMEENYASMGQIWDIDPDYID